MGAWTKQVALVVVLALTASLTAAAPATAQDAGGTVEPRQGASEVSPQGGSDRPPLGGPIPDDSGGLDEAPDLKGVAQPGEVTARRTETTRTVVADDGTYQTTFYDHPIHFRDAQGAWQAIDTTLVPGARPGSLRTKAGPVEVSLPSTLRSGPVRVARAGTAVEFSLLGATGAQARSGVPPALRGRSEAVAQSAATYAGALSGVDAVYTAMPEGVKEELVLAGLQAPTSFDFRLRLSAGLSAVEAPGGGLAIHDAEGAERARIGAPFVADASHTGEGLGGDGPGYSTTAVSLRIVEPGAEPVVRLAVDPGWLAAPERAWPVVIDPSMTISSSNHDTYLGSGTYANTNYGSSTIMGIGGGTTRFRTLQQRSILSFFDEPAVVTGASLQLYVTNDTSTSAQREVAIHELRASWSSGQATWNDRLSGTPWASPGGDVDPLPLWKGTGIIGAPGWRSFPVTRAFQGWVDNTTPNHGVLIKYLDEAAGPQVVFASTNHSDSTIRPRMVVNWEPLQGLRDHYGYQDFDLGGTRRARVNLASGNLTVSQADLPIAGSGLDPLVQRFYNSRSPYQGSMGSRWVMWPQSKERLYEGSARDLFWRGGPPERLVFSPTGRYDGTLTVPQGYPATMGVVGPGMRYELAHTNGIRYRFYASGYPDQVIDAAGNTITFGYVTNAAGENEMTSLTDSKAGVVSFERSAPNKVVRMVDPAGRNHRYGYSTDSFGNVVLATYTDPAGKITRYGYEGQAMLKTLTDPDGMVTTFVSDPDGRLKSLTRGGKTWGFDYSTPWRTTVTDPNGNLTTHSFNRRGQITSSSGPPYAPTNVRAVPGDGRAALSWEAATPNGSPVTGYTLTASPGGASTTAAGGATSTMFEGLTNGTAYTFTAVATNAIGNSVASVASNEVTPQSDSSLLAPLVAPTSVVATRGDTQAHVSWTKPTLSLPLITAYDVTTYRASDGVELGTTSAGTKASVTVPGLKNGTPVYFTVTARSLLLSGTSEPSNTITPAGAPFAPTDVVATRGDRQVEVSWNPPGPRPDGTPGDNGDPISSYTVTAFRADNNEEVSSTDAASSPGTVNNLANGTAYYFTVHATNGVGAGQKSVPTNTVIPAGRPFSPTNVSASAGAAVGEAIIRWSPPPVQHDGIPGDNGDPIVTYTVRAQPGGASTTTGANATSTVLAGLRPGDTYTFTVTATNGVGNSAESAPSNSVTLTGPPDPPTNVTAVSSGDTATVNWVAPSRLNGSTLTGYIVTGTPVAGAGSEVSVPVNDPAATSTTVSGLNGGTTYEFRVVATSDLGNSAPSEPSAGVTPETEPGAPTGVQAVPGDARVTVSWTAPTDLNGSQITGYELSVTPECSPPCTGLTLTGANNTSTVVENGLTNGTSYTFQVRAKSTAGPGPYSAGVESIPHRPTYVAMGDSFSAGVGAKDVNENDSIGGEHEMCQRADEAYGPVYHNMQSADADLVFFACGGAVTGHPDSPAEGTEGLTAIHKFFGEGGQLSRLPEYADLVTLTIGGNDVGFSQVLLDCFTNIEKPCYEQYGAGSPDDTEAQISGMRAILTDVYQAIRDRAPNARIAVLTYPQLITESDNCWEQADYVPSGIQLDDNEKRWIRARTGQLGDVIVNARNATGDPHLVAVDVEELGRFADNGNGICAQPDSERYVNGFTPSDHGESFHPTVPGYVRLAQDLLTRIGSVV